MAEQSNGQVGITITGRDTTKPAFTSATAGVTKMSSRFTGFGKQMESMPDKLGKASAALFLFQGSMARSGGATADVANKVVSLAALAATGGPLGIALAGVTGLIALGSSAWDVFTKETREAREGLARMREEATRTRDAISDLTLSITSQLNVASAKAAGISRDVAVLMDKQAQIVERNSEAINEYNALSDLAGASAMGWTKEEEAKGKELRVQIATYEEQINKIGALIGIKNDEVENDKEAAAERDRITERDRKNSEARIARGQAFADTQKRWNEEANAQLDALMRADDNRAAKELASKTLRAKNIMFLDNLIEKNRKELQDNRESEEEERWNKEAARLERLGELAQETGAIMADSFITASAAMADGSKSAGEAFSDAMNRMTLSGAAMVLRIIQQQAALAAAKAFAAHQGLPGIGLAIGAGAAAAASAAAMSYAQRMQHGGEVRGGMPGVDSVPALLEPGEFVVPSRVVRAIRGEAAASTSTTTVNNGGGLTVNVTPRLGERFRPRDILELGRQSRKLHARIVARGGAL